MSGVELAKEEASVDYTGCGCGKRGYPSRTRARRAHKTSGARLRFYKCPATGLWHATNDEKRQRHQSPRRQTRRVRLRPSRRWPGISPFTIYARLDRGWSDEEALRDH